MKASDAQDGKKYLVRGKEMLCQGWNHTKEWLLFLTYLEGKRKICMVLPENSIEELVT